MRTFFVLWISQAISLFGSALVEFSLAWYLARETGSATILATAVLVAFLPQIILGPIIGPFIDRWNRKRIMIVSDLAISLMTVGLIVLFFTGSVQVWHIYVAMVGRAIGQSFHFPAMLASVPLIVPEKHLARTAGLNQMLQGVVGIAAPPAGALLLGFLPMERVLAVDVVTAVIAVGCLLVIAIPRPERTTLAAKSSPIQDMVQGFRYLWSNRGLTMLMFLGAAIGFFFIPPFSLMPILVTRHLGGDVLKLGWLNSTFGVGMIAGGLVLGTWGGFKKRIVTSAVGIIMASVATIGLGFTSVPLYFLSLASSFLVGVGISFASAPFMALFQSIVAKDMLGRIMSLIGSLTSAMTPLGLAVAGPVADAAGIRWLFFIAGGASVFIGVWMFFSRSLMGLEKTPPDIPPGPSVRPQPENAEAN
jgi:DHA3 family macrolide efflux protein-like MFS transporter